MSGVEEPENRQVSDLALTRLKNMQELAEARAKMVSAARDLNKDVLAEFNNNKRRMTVSPGKFRRPSSPLIERKSSRLSGKVVDYTGLDFDDGVKSGKRYLDDDDKLMAKLTLGAKKRRHTISISRASVVPELKPEDVTQDMLNNINYMSTGKVYSAEYGKSCHQCRQKTVDTKSHCRSGWCVGVRGQFCGACLRDHYGEDLADVLMDPIWTCPLCRGVCNCSFCRKKAGKAPLGQVSGLVRRKGYKSVHHFLMETEGMGEEVDLDESLEDRKESKDNIKETKDDIKKFIVEDDAVKKARCSAPWVMLVKLPFGKTKKNEVELGSDSKAEQKEQKNKKKGLKSRKEMEEMLFKMKEPVPETKEDIVNLKNKVTKELEIDWESLLASEEKSFKGFAERNQSQFLTWASDVEKRQEKFRLEELLKKELHKIEESVVSAKAQFEGF